MKILALFSWFGLLSLVALGSALASGPPEPVPEPTTVLLLVSGFVGVAGFWRMFKK